MAWDKRSTSAEGVVDGVKRVEGVEVLLVASITAALWLPVSVTSSPQAPFASSTPGIAAPPPRSPSPSLPSPSLASPSPSSPLPLAATPSPPHNPHYPLIPPHTASPPSAPLPSPPLPSASAPLGFAWGRVDADPSYVANVFKSYISNKQKQGASAEEISTKLNYIQLRFPHFDHIAAEVRENLGLPKKPN